MELLLALSAGLVAKSDELGKTNQYEEPKETDLVDCVLLVRIRHNNSMVFGSL